jgi:SAM-dependent methyltransferase
MPWAHLEKYHKIYEQPAEIPIAELVGAVDMIFAINSLDHAFDLEAILGNMLSYLRPGGRAFISVDVDKPITQDPTHPLRLRSETVRSSLLRHGFVIEKEEMGKCNPAGESSWGGGTAYHCWLKKPARASPSSGVGRNASMLSASPPDAWDVRDILPNCGRNSKN